MTTRRLKTVTNRLSSKTDKHIPFSIEPLFYCQFILTYFCLNRHVPFRMDSIPTEGDRAFRKRRTLRVEGFDNEEYYAIVSEHHC